jgi:hypothetical protein
VVQPVLPIPATNIDWITAANNKEIVNSFDYEK